MRLIPKKYLFWFIPEGTKVDLDKDDQLDTYTQQVFTHGQAKDVKEFLKIVDGSRIKSSFGRINRFLPFEIKKFWEDFIGNNFFSSKGNS